MDLTASLPEHYVFGRFPLSPEQIFFETEHTLAITNIQPTVIGHVLVIPKRTQDTPFNTGRLSELSVVEIADLFVTAQRVAGVVEEIFTATAVTVTAQDGTAAGQTVHHPHVHVIPRRAGDFRRNDEVYEAIHDMSQEQQFHAHSYPTPAKLPLYRRSIQEMSAEATMLRPYFV
jgi:bis(5'-adenosyl)-triphosphatase